MPRPRTRFWRSFRREQGRACPACMGGGAPPTPSRGGTTRKRSGGAFQGRTGGCANNPKGSKPGRGVWGAIQPYPRISRAPLPGQMQRTARRAASGPHGKRERAAPWGGRRVGAARSCNRAGHLGGDTPLSADKGKTSDLLAGSGGRVAGTEARTSRKAASGPHGRRERAAPWGGGSARPGVPPGGTFEWRYTLIRG